MKSIYNIKVGLSNLRDETNTCGEVLGWVWLQLLNKFDPNIQWKV